MEQIANGVHSSSSPSSQHLLYTLQNNNNSSKSNNNNNSLHAIEMSVLDRQRERFNGLNWTSSEQMNGPFNSSASEVFTNGVMPTEWQQFAAQSGHLLMANRGETAMFGVKNPLNLQNGWPNLSNNLSSIGLVKSGEENSSLVTASFDSEPGFAECGAKLSAFNDNGQMLAYRKASVAKMMRNNSEGTACSNDSEGRKLICRTASAEKIKENLTSIAEESAVSQKLSAGNGKFPSENAGRKRKNDRTRTPEMKAADSEDSKEKRSKSDDSGAKEKGDLRKRKTEQSNSDNSVESSPKSVKENSKASESQKQDYIHVRARRGQATDSHSLAERVRREKISERMKYLQDLVPGCNKVTGKAVMLDEIINYVQSLQRQVEFLSMKLASVNPRLDLNIDNFFFKEIMPPCGNFPSLGGMTPDLPPYLQFHHMQQQQSSMQTGVCSGFEIPTIISSVDTTPMHRTATVPVSSELFVDANFQGHAPSAWDTELQNVFGTGLIQGRQPPFASQGLPGHLDINHMKMEL